MSFKLKKSTIEFINLILIYIIVTIGLASSSNESREFIELIRNLSIVIFIITFCLDFLYRRNRLTILISSLILVSLSIFGTLLSIIYGGLQDYKSDIITFVLIIAGCYVLSSKYLIINQVLFAKWVIIYCLIILLISIVLDGLILFPSPTFVYSYATETLDKGVYYSQGISRFFGLSALAAAFLIISAKTKISKYTFILLTFLFIGFSLLGGGRGDSVLALILVIMYLMYRLGVKDKIITILSILFLLIFIASFISFDGFIIFDRLGALSENYGSRDILLKESLSLLYNDVGCLFHGCGFGFFQSYYNYRIGLYPHNFIIESIIVFGLPIAFLLIFLFVKGLTKYVQNNQSSDLIVLLTLYNMLLGLKSGSINNSWLLMIFFIFFIAYSFTAKFRENYI